MQRVIMLRSGVFGACAFRAGLCHALPEEMAAKLVDAGWAYYEGDEPPLAPTDIERMNQKEDREANVTFELAVLRAARQRAKEEQILKVRRQEEQAARDIAALRAARAARNTKRG